MEILGNNNLAIAFLRVSSHRQKDNTSHETQEKEIRHYCRDKNFDLVNIVRIVESAKRSEERKQYNRARSEALMSGVVHFLFYIYDRETRNLTDNEQNENLVRDGRIIIHYVNEKKVLHQYSPDTDFFMRDIQAATNKQFLRNLSTKVRAAHRNKSENGWYPFNHPPLGYAHQRIKDESGRELKR